MATKDQKGSVRDEQFGSAKSTAENTEEKKIQEALSGAEKEALTEKEVQENKTKPKAVKKEPAGSEKPVKSDKKKKTGEEETQESDAVSGAIPDKTTDGMKVTEGKKKQKVVEVKKPIAETSQEAVSKKPVQNEEKEPISQNTGSSENNVSEEVVDSGNEQKTGETPKKETIAKKSDKEEEQVADVSVVEENTFDNKAETGAEPEEKAKKTKISEKSGQTEEPVKAETEIEAEAVASDEQAETVEAKNEDHKKPEKGKQPEKEKIDYSALNPADLVATLRDLLNDKSVLDIRNDVEIIKINFYKRHKAEVDRIKRKFLEEEGELKDFKVEENPLETELKELLKKYKDLKSEYNKTLEEEKQKNLEEKYRIIEEIKDLVNRKESINKTFQEFRELQQQWRSVGLVPQQSLKDLWETYHHHVETFYDYININKELRDLDLKKNLEAKIELCEKAEELLLEPSVINAFNRLQKLHDLWREIGPVPAEMRTEIWERFKETTSKINKRHQEYFINLKHEQKSNLEAKTTLCEKAEEISNLDISTHKELEKKSNEIIQLQKVWKTIGFAPKKDNNKIYQRFREACDNFFNKKREFYAQTREEQTNNLQLKTDLCVQAESLQDSTEWQKTTEELISLQKKWKEIGPVPHKYSDKIWKRFRAACDKFFQNKAEHFSEQDSSYSQNLKKKQELIKEIENFKGTTDVEANFEKLKDFQRRWVEIGFVPYKFKDEIQEQYKAVINKQFDNLKIDDNQKNLLKFKTKIENLEQKPNSYNRLRHERDKYINKLKQLENDIVLWENNIGFFAKSKNADTMIREVKEKIDNAKKNIELLKEKIQIIDEKD